MNTFYPRIRPYSTSRTLQTLAAGDPPHGESAMAARDVVRFAFYLPHDHSDIASGVSHAVDSYLRAVEQGPAAIHHAYIDDDEGGSLNEERWEYIRELLGPERVFRFIDDLDEDSVRILEKRGYATQLLFNGGLRGRSGYELFYQARIPWRTPSPGSMSLLTATLPTEYLASHGPEKVRELALDMASQLPFASGHAGLALHFYWMLDSTDDACRAELARYPGIDLRTAWLPPTSLGDHVDGVHWLNFLAPPVLGQMGGAKALRARLSSPATAVHELDAERAVISLGDAPEAGDLAAGRTLPAYREFARVVEPWLEPFLRVEGYDSDVRFSDEEARRWWRRWLD